MVKREGRSIGICALHTFARGYLNSLGLCGRRSICPPSHRDGIIKDGPLAKVRVLATSHEQEAESAAANGEKQDVDRDRRGREGRRVVCLQEHVIAGFAEANPNHSIFERPYKFFLEEFGWLAKPGTPNTADYAHPHPARP